MRSLAATVPMQAMRHGMRQSFRGVLNYRIAGLTNDRFWSVDVYSRDYFVVTVRNLTVVRPSIPGAINHLRKLLNV